MQRNMRRYRRALPNGTWKLLRLPADVYMVRSIFYSPARPHFNRVTVVSLCV
jgi:hypothetical protein